MDFVLIVLTEIERLGIADQVTLQSFDIEILERSTGRISRVYLVQNFSSLEQNLERMSITPAIYAPFHLLVNADIVEKPMSTV